MPGFPAYHQLPEPAQTHVHGAGDIIQPSSNHLILCRTLLSCLQSCPASGSFPVSQFFPSGGQSIGVSASASVLPMNNQDWFSLGWTDWISLQSKGLTRVFSNTTVQKQILLCSAFFIVQLSHPYVTAGKTIAMTRQTFVGKVMSLLFNMLSSLVIAFLPRSKHLLKLWSQKTHKKQKAIMAILCWSQVNALVEKYLATYLFTVNKYCYCFLIYFLIGG